MNLRRAAGGPRTLGPAHASPAAIALLVDELDSRSRRILARNAGGSTYILATGNGDVAFERADTKRSRLTDDEWIFALLALRDTAGVIADAAERLAARGGPHADEITWLGCHARHRHTSGPVTSEPWR